MLTIMLDEQGRFEQRGGAEMEEPLFIGGLIYDDKGSVADCDLEKRRIRAYLRAVCEEARVPYPRGLHYENGGPYNHRLREVKQRIADTLGNFLRYGRCPIQNASGEELRSLASRRGKYYVFALARFGTVHEDLEGDDTSILVREDYASNLYVHMAEEIVERIIFHNPVLKVAGEVTLDLATRMAVVEGEDAAVRAREYQKLGYREREDLSRENPGRRYFSLTNADIYRTAIEREMLDTGMHQIQLDRVRVHSIYYGSEQNNYSMEFLFLADVICSVLGFQTDTSSAQALIEDMAGRARRYTGHEDNLIFAYDAVDTLFKKAWRRLEERDYFESLRLTREGMRMDSPYADYYKNTWFPRLVERLEQEKDAGAFGVALRKYSRFSERSNLNQEDLVRIYESLERMAGRIAFEREEDEAVLYELYDTGISAYSHIGDSLRAKECFEKCVQYAGRTELERYLKTRNRRVVYLMDNFDYAEALDIAQDNVLYQDELVKIRAMISKENESRRRSAVHQKESVKIQETSVHYGMVLSQLGQVQAALRQKEAADTFENALQQFGDPASSDYNRTLSYLLHYDLEMGNQEEYDRRVAEYFGGEREPGAQLTFLIREGAREQGRFSMKFALYVYMKGLYQFHLEEISERLLERLYRIEREIEQVGGETASAQINNHPWEIIYKYLALIAWKKGEEEKADAFMEKTRSVLPVLEYTLEAVCLFGELEYAREKEDFDKSNQCMEKLLAHLGDRNQGIREKAETYPEEAGKYQYLREQVFSYMYR